MNLYVLDDDSLEEWSKNGPYSKPGLLEGMFGRLDYLKTNPKASYHHLLDALFSPQIKLAKLSNPEDSDERADDIVAAIRLPRFNKGKDTLKVEVKLRTWHWKGKGIVYDHPVVREPYKIREMMDEESNTFLGYIYYYRGEQGVWTAFTRLETADGFILPMPERRRGSGP